MAWEENLSYGNRASYFGDQDYFQALKKVWDAGEAGDERQKKLAQTRQDILSWMGKSENLDKIDATNRLGVEGGLGHRIATGDLTHVFQGAAGPTSKDWFGDADLWAARAAGHSFTDILSHLDKGENVAPLRDRNRPGHGGLYDQVKTQAKFEGERADWSDSVSDLQESMGMQFTDLSGAFEEGMGGVSDAISAQTAAEERYRADQQNWQRRQENMQQMMIQEGRRKSKEKPVMAVMPGQGSYGGGGGGAAAFARKKKQTTGLNIA